MIYFGILLLIALRIYSYNTLTGKRYFRDHWDQICLKTKSLAAWDQVWANNPNRSEIIICLTTIPSRINHIEGTLKSLCYQTCAPQRIRLHLPAYSKREHRPYVVPESLTHLKAVEIVASPDYGPATKVISALQVLPPNQPILVLDDDRLYPPTLVENFVKWSKAHPHWAIGTAGWIVPANLTDHARTFWTNLWQIPPVPMKSTRIKTKRQVNILEGYAGYLVKPRFFDLESLTNYSNAPEAAFYVDDVWISAQCRVPKYIFPARRHVFDHWWRWVYDRSALYRINDGGGDPEKRNNTIMIRHFKDRWEPLY